MKSKEEGSSSKTKQNKKMQVLKHLTDSQEKGERASITVSRAKRSIKPQKK